MNSISFPKMFNKTTTQLKYDHDATQQNLHYLLGSERGELSGDPYFGIRLKRYMFDQNNYILKDVLIDEIYTQIATFMPQLKLKRTDINIVQDGTTLNATVRAQNRLDFTTNMYNIVLLTQEDM